MTPEPLFPGFKTSPIEGEPPKQKALHITPYPEPGPIDNNDDDDACPDCEGWGYFDCFCGGDLCVCSYGGERPCWNCV